MSGSVGQFSMSDVQINLQVDWENLDDAFGDLERECSEIVRGLSIEAWNFTLQQTPQFEGRLVASWSYSLNQPHYVDRSRAAELITKTADQFLTDDDEGDVFSGRRKGDPEAIAIANLGSEGKEMPFALGMSIFFANGVDHGEGPYAADIERGAAHLRPVNQPGRMAERAFDRLAARYGSGVSARKADELKSMRIGK